MEPSTSGVRFENVLPESADFNILNYLYYYNGGGVAVGDYDGDGRPDLYFTSNLGANHLYRNLGNFRFEDVTAKAGVADSVGWKTGVTMVDVTGDGRLDLYVSGVNYLGEHGRNVLYVNKGDGTFADETEARGLAQAAYGTQALFLDYDGDGDLDAYLLNHATHTERNIGAAAGVSPDAAADRLLRNDGGHFTDVSAQAGLVRGLDGFGLGVVSSDFNGDGCPDVYVANDFQENDLLYVNDCHGGFREAIRQATRHTSRFSMGVDAADIDDDGRPDVFTGDMLPEREDVLKTSASSETFNLFNLRLRAGYHPQYARNALQLNRGTVDGVPRFSEVGYLAGVHATDWTWAPLFADFDNDGRKDLFVANGIYRRPNDLDYINYVGNDAAQAALASGDRKTNAEILRKMPQVSLPNHAYRNEGSLHFTDVAAQWGVAEPGWSTGVAYVDLDGDGALDLVVNRVNQPALVYRNMARARNGNHFLRVALRGTGANSDGIGARVWVTAGGKTQLVEQQPTRGFQSSVDHVLHVGLGKAAAIDSVVVAWPDGRRQAVARPTMDTTLVLLQQDATGTWTPARDTVPATFADATAEAHLEWKHVETPYLDTDREPLMPHLLSDEGPALAVADVDGDGLDDVFLGGGKWQADRLLVQRRDGSFAVRDEAVFAPDSITEDVRATFLDANGDGHPDLYVVTAGNEFREGDPQLLDRLYLNDGTGHFRLDPGALPPLAENGGCVAAGDFDGDGAPDLFVGTRDVPGSYGVAPHSHLLRNDGKGHFADVTGALAPALAQPGMVTACAWTTWRGKPALVVAGEWMPVRLFAAEDGRLVERSREAGLEGTEGWWSSVTVADVNGDGRPDLVLGNLGRNAWVKASDEEPARLYVHDFGGTGVQKQILTFWRHGKSYPLAGRDDIVRLVPSLRSRYPSYSAFGAATVEDIFPAQELKAATVLEARQLSSMVALAGADGRHALRALPAEAQFAPVYAAVAGDFDGDGCTDLLLGGNHYGVPPVLGRYDASWGTLLAGAGDGRFAAVDLARSGVHIDGQVRGMATVRGAAGTASSARVIVARNDDAPIVLRPRPTTKGSTVLARRAAPVGSSPMTRTP